jgi:hypothetical protein
MMLIIAYDLHPALGRDYSPVENAIKSYGIWAHVEGSVWVIDTLDDPKTVTERLMAVGLPQDTFFVGRLQQNWWSNGLTTTVIEWLKDTSRRW